MDHGVLTTDVEGSKLAILPRTPIEQPSTIITCILPFLSNDAILQRKRRC